MTTDRRALAFGVLLSGVLAGTLVIAGLKAGITPGVSPLVVLLSWGIFRSWSSEETGPRSYNIAQVAGSSGMAVTAGVIFTAPMLPILGKAVGMEPSLPPLGTLILVSIAGALIGFGIVGSATRRFLADPTYPAPEARAAATLVQTATTDASSRPKLGRSLVPAVMLGFLSPLLVRLNLAREHIVLAAREIDGRSFQFDLPFTPIYIGIGALLSFSTGVLVFAGSSMRLVGDFLLTTMPLGMTADAWPSNSMRWVGGAAMSVAVTWALLRYFLSKGAAVSTSRSAEGEPETTSLPEVVLTSSDHRLLFGSMFLGFGLLFGWLFALAGVQPFSLTMVAVVLATTSFMSVLGAVLSLQIGSSASPVSGTVFVTVLIICLVMVAFQLPSSRETVLMLTCLAVASCVAVCSANDASQDYRTMQLCGVPVRIGLVSQLSGLLVGSIVVPIVTVVAHEAYGLGTEALPAPQGQMFATLAQGLLFTRSIPLAPILAGAGIGLLAVATEEVARRRGHALPSMALAVGLYLPAYLGVGILIGATARRVAEGTRGQTYASILCAAGLITGAATFDLLFGVAILSGTDGLLPQLTTSNNGLRTILGLLGIAAISGWIFITSRDRD